MFTNLLHLLQIYYLLHTKCTCEFFVKNLFGEISLALVMAFGLHFNSPIEVKFQYFN